MKRLISAMLVLAVVFGSAVTCLAAATIRHPQEARDVLDYVNEERRAAGLSVLKWESSLVDFAYTRAGEITTLWSHTRPNGGSATDYPGCNGENLAYGTDYTAADVVEGWMNSPSHRDNILEPAYTSMAVACIEKAQEVQGYGEVPYYYWVQLFHVDAGAAKSTETVTASGEGSVSEPKSGGTFVSITAAEASSAAQRAAAAARSSGAAFAAATMRNAGEISLAALQGMTKAAGMPVRLNADSMSADGKSVEVRITLDPAKSTKALNLSGSTSNSEAARIKAIFERYFTNTVLVVSLGQKGSFGQPVEVIVKLDPSLKSDSLVFYSYDAATNVHKRIENTKYWVDKSGYVHFTTELAGEIIITDRELTRG